MKEVEPEYRVIIQPNRSLSGRGMLCLFLAYVLLGVTLATGFALSGAWLVAPFMGLEGLVIGVVLCWVARHARDREIVIVDDDRMEIVQIDGRAEHRLTLQRYWARVNLETQDDGWYPSRLLVGSHGRWLEIGAALNDDERESLSRRLRSILRPQLR
ncbi:MAG: DUF2244 domain-containing protein [Acidiferrobacterales bacterium]